MRIWSGEGAVGVKTGLSRQLDLYVNVVLGLGFRKTKRSKQTPSCPPTSRLQVVTTYSWGLFQYSFSRKRVFCAPFGGPFVLHLDNMFHQKKKGHVPLMRCIAKYKLDRG